MSAKITEIRDRLANAGDVEKWESNGNAVHRRVTPSWATCVCICEGEKRRELASFIANAPTDITFLLAEIDRLKAEIDRLQPFELGGVTEEMIRRNDGNILLGRGCTIVRDDDWDGMESEIASLKAALELMSDQLAREQSEAREVMAILDSARVPSNGEEGEGKRQSLTIPHRVARLKVKIDALRAKLHPWYGDCDGLADGGACSECKRVAEEDVAVYVENVRLKAALELGQINCDAAYNELRSERDAALVENDRLRGSIGIAHGQLIAFSGWRKRCWEHDDDMENERRDFSDDEAWDMIEQQAGRVAKSIKEVK